MKEIEKYPLDEIKVKGEYSPYKRYEDIPGGKKVFIDIPNMYNIELTCYNLIPGLSILIDDSEIKDKLSDRDDILEYDNPEDYLIINYIIEGQCRLEVVPDKYMFLKDKDINLYIKGSNTCFFSYLGKTKVFHILINRKQFNESEANYHNEYKIMISELFEQITEENNILFKSPENITKIITELFEFKSKRNISQRMYFQLKTLELLLELFEYEIRDEKMYLRTYTDAQIRVVRTIKNSLSRNIASYISLDTLSVSYGINLTTLKNCFRDMYGKPLYTWYKEYKFYRAQELIKNTDYPISKIANMIGYKSSSKFAQAFKKEMGVLPSSYRKKKK